MLHLLLVGLAATVAPAPQIKPARPASRPAFTFRDWRPRDAYKPDDPRLRLCVDIPAGHACIFRDNRIGGVEARQIGAAFGPAGLFALEAKFPNDTAHPAPGERSDGVSS